MKKIIIAVLFLFCLLPSVSFGADAKASADATVVPASGDLIIGLQGGTANKNYAVTSFLAAGGTAANSSLLDSHNAAYFQVAGSYSTISGTPANHYWPSWVSSTAIKGTSITASKPVCSDASGDPGVCAGTEGVWQVAGSYLTAASALDATKLAAGSDARGDILIRGASTYGRLAKGTSGAMLRIGANDPAWSTETWPVPGAVGGIMYSDGTNWVRLAAGTDGYFLKGKGAAAPEFAAITIPNQASLNIDDIQTALGIADGAVNFGTFTGSTIADNVVAKAALQSLETAVELRPLSASMATDNSLASPASGLSRLLYKDSDGHIENAIIAIDAHAASTTITLIPGICPVIHNASQAASDINNALPVLAEGICFVAQVRTTQAKYWRLTAASAGTLCLDGTCGKNYVSFDNGQLTVGNYYTCMYGATDTTAQLNCYSGKGTAVTN